MQLFLVTILAVTAVGNDGPMPADFLHTESKAWNAWLDEPIRGSWIRMTVRDVLAGGFGPAELVVASDKVGDKRVTVEAKGRSRREVLWRLNKQHGLDLKWSRKGEPTSFLGLPETHARKDGPGGATTMTQVELADYKTYEKLRLAGEVKKEMRLDRVVFFSITTKRDIPFENATAWVFVTERFKAKLPQPAR